MKAIIFALTALTLLRITTFTATTPNNPTKEADQICKATGFTKTKHGWENSCPACEITTYTYLNDDELKDGK